MTVTERRIADDPAGMVIEQHPAPGEFLRDGDEIEVVVSRGPPPVAIPVVAGKGSAEAGQLLQQAGFVVVPRPTYDENVAQDIVLGTDPAAGTKLTPEKTVTMIVSNGPAPVAVPDVAGKSFADAAQILAGKRFKATERDDFSDSVAAGTVIGTDPAANQPAPRDSTVTVIVSKGPQIVTVPAIVGQTVEQASAMLSAVGLTPDVQNYGPGKKVRASDPLPGAQVPKGSKVTLFL